jgi:hypothetical protein
MKLVSGATRLLASKDCGRHGAQREETRSLHIGRDDGGTAWSNSSPATSARTYSSDKQPSTHVRSTGANQPFTTHVRRQLINKTTKRVDKTGTQHGVAQFALCQYTANL